MVLVTKYSSLLKESLLISLEALCILKLGISIVDSPSEESSSNKSGGLIKVWAYSFMWTWENKLSSIGKAKLAKLAYKDTLFLLVVLIDFFLLL